MNKKLSAYSSVLLLIVVFLMAFSLILINLVTNQNIILKKTIIDSYQSKYIAESYLNLFLTSLEDDTDLSLSLDKLSVNLFPELDHQKSFQIFPDEYYFDQPANKVLIKSDYKKIKSSAEAYISKYNKIFFLKTNVIRGPYLEEKNNVYLEIFKEKINSGIIFGDNISVFEFSENDILVRDLYNKYLIGRWSEYGDLVITDSFSNMSAYIIKNQVELVSQSDGGKFVMGGIIYLEGTLELNSDFVFSGIIISDGGKINTNGNNFDFKGKLIEIGDGGSFSNINVENLKKEELLKFLEKLNAAKLRRPINIKINNNIKSNS